MTKRCFRMVRNILFKLIPAIMVIPDFFAVHANGDNPLQLSYSGQSLTQVLDML